MNNYSTASWREVMKSLAFRIHLAIVFSILLLIAASISKFFLYIQTRQGLRIDDPLLSFVASRDLSPYIFLLVYGGIVFGLFRLIKFPVNLLCLTQAYCLLTMIRVVTLMVVPLEHPDSIVPLADPVLDNLFYDHKVITKDLFFSGHVATTFLFVFAIPSKIEKYLFLLVSIALGILMLIQHAHYTIDIAVAPFFSWLSYRVSKLIDNAIASGFD